jgi:hypothetical protein
MNPNFPLSDAARTTLNVGALVFVGQVYIKFPDGTQVAPDIHKEIGEFVNSLQLVANETAKAALASLFKINGLVVEGLEEPQIH